MQKIIEAINNLHRDIPIHAAYLRGSYLNNFSKNVSDIDLIIVTDYLSNISQHVRRKILSSYFEEISPHVDLLCITRSELSLYSTRPIFKLEPIKQIFISEGM